MTAQKVTGGSPQTTGGTESVLFQGRPRDKWVKRAGNKANYGLLYFGTEAALPEREMLGHARSVWTQRITHRKSCGEEQGPFLNSRNNVDGENVCR